MADAKKAGPAPVTEEVPAEQQVPLQEDPNTGLPAGFGGTDKPVAAIPKSAQQTPPTEPGEGDQGNMEGLEDLPPEFHGVPEELWPLAPHLPEGITLQNVNEWKKRFGDIYFVDICDNLYFYRAMSKPEYKNILNMEGGTREMQEEKITELCTLYPTLGVTELRMGLAGLATTLSEYVMRASGFGNLNAPTKI